MSLLNDLLRPQGERHPKPAPASVPQLFLVQQKVLAEGRDNVVAAHQQLHRDLFGHSHVAAWDDLYPLIRVVENSVRPAGLVCIFGVCAYGANASAATVQPAPFDLVNDLFTLGVLVEFIPRAQADEPAARQWHAYYHRCFHAQPGAPLQDIVNEVTQRQPSLEARILSQLIWLKTEAISFFPDPGKPTKGWQDAYTFFWGYQRLSPAVRNQLDPCQLLIARLPKK